jgi:DNA processing protein
MAEPLSEHRAYHALGIALDSNYRSLALLFERHGTWSAALEKLPKKRFAARDPMLLLSELERYGIKLILREDAGFPSLLREIPLSPHGIYVRGTVPETGVPAVAIVGTRKATTEGKEAARTFGKALAEADCVIVSGLALGVDAAAHEGALEGGGRTVAILATGLDRVYPQFNAKLAERILKERGAIVSEYPPGSSTFPYRFLERNRIVSGLSQGTLVIEAPLTSGSLVTARFALEQNRLVFVLPGPATHPNFAGSHELIRSGAELVTRPAHILEAFGIVQSTSPASVVVHSDNPAEQQVIDVIRAAGKPVEIDKIAELTNLETHIVSQLISFLIIRNIIHEAGSGYAIKER